MKYEIINPSDRCFVTANDERLAIIACYYLGEGLYGLRSENGDTILAPFEQIDAVLDLTEGAISSLIENHTNELAEVFESFCYEGERTSLNDIGARAKKYAEALRNRGEDNG